MNTIKNINRLTGHIDPYNLTKLELGANLHLRNSNITFKILSANDTELHVRTEQGKSLAENYADAKTLITRTRELFEKFLPGKTIYTHPVPYKESVVNEVDSTWVKAKMLEKGVKLKDISADTGIDKTNLSGYINDLRPFSQPIKALFYYYFK